MGVMSAGRGFGTGHRGVQVSGRGGKGGEREGRESEVSR